MKKMVMVMAALLALVSFASADVYTWTGTVTNGQPATLSDQIPVSGLLDKLEVFQSYTNIATSTVVVATYDAGSQNNITNAVETYATLTLTAAKVIRLTSVPTDNTGTALTGALSASDVSTNGVTRVLTIPYRQPMIGSNLRVSLAGTTISPQSATNTVTVRFFYDPLRR
jgi:hypothetical protein